MATFGSRNSIDDARRSVLGMINKEFEVYTSLNEGRNPLAGLETYIIPLTIATASYILRAVADLTCSDYSQTCRNTSELLSHIYVVVIIFLLIMGATKAQQLKEFFGRLKSAVHLVANGAGCKEKK